MIRHVPLLTLFTTLLYLTGCSVEESRNVQRKSCTECERLGGTCISGFCVLSDAGVAGDAATADADSGDAAADAEAPKPCSEEGQVEYCYGGRDPATATQQPCKPGARKCQNGFFGACEGDVVPKNEQCNNVDDDCDGEFDEELGTPSECPMEGLQGECAIGVQLCRGGQPRCLQVNFPQSDVCNGRDDDCDGATDEKTEVACYDGASDGCNKDSSGEYECTGSCQAGTQTCKDGQYEASCAGQISPENEDTCTEAGQASADEDCDGEVDEGCDCVNGIECYTGAANTQTHAPCHTGVKACSDATRGTCEDEVTPTAEHCGNEGVDNDCDGVADDIPWRDTSCADASEADGACKSGARWQCVDRELQCVAAQPGTERCDGQNVDENCNGEADEGFDLMTDRSNCGACGVVCASGLSCCGGRCVNVTSNNAHCSACGNVCAAGTACCSNSCVNVQTDPNNCGTCGNVCSGLLKGCTNGVCTKLLL